MPQKSIFDLFGKKLPARRVTVNIPFQHHAVIMKSQVKQVPIK